MIIVACILLLLAAVFGLINLTSILKDKQAPRLAVMAHGIIAVFALFALAAYTVVHPDTLLITGDILLVLAALGGFGLLMIDLSGKPIPKKIAMMHPLLAVVGVGCIFTYVYRIFS